MASFRRADDARPFSEIKDERASGDPYERRRELAFEEIERLEGEARVALAEGRLDEGRLLQLEAEELRAALADAMPNKRR
jgi:hypothetical protein